jgi:hypothetical protein
VHLLFVLRAPGLAGPFRATYKQVEENYSLPSVSGKLFSGYFSKKFPRINPGPL